MPDVIIYFGPLELLAAVALVAAAAGLLTWAISARRTRRQRQRLLDSLPYPALRFVAGRPAATNAPGLGWRDNLDVRAIASDARRRGQTVVRAIPAVEGQGFQARAIALAPDEILVLLEDLAAAQRQQAFYRNFIQNVSYEV